MIVLNDFFTSFFTTEDSIHLLNFEVSNCISEMNRIIFIVEKIKKKLKKLNESKTPGPNGHHPKLQKNFKRHNFVKYWASCLLSP